MSDRPYSICEDFGFAFARISGLTSDRRYPILKIVEPSFYDDGGYCPGQTVTINGKAGLIRLGSLITRALEILDELEGN